MLGNKEIQIERPSKCATCTPLRRSRWCSRIRSTRSIPAIRSATQIMRTLEKFGVGSTVAERRQRMLELLDLVKLPRAFENRMPRQLLRWPEAAYFGVGARLRRQRQGGGGRQPSSALDVSVPAAVTELLMDIQRKNKTTMLFISHDLSVVRTSPTASSSCTSATSSSKAQPTANLLAALSPLYGGAAFGDPDCRHQSSWRRHIVLEGDIPSAMNPPSGCPFQTRCRYKHLVPDRSVPETQVPPNRDAQAPDITACAGFPTRFWRASSRSSRRPRG